MGVTTVTLGYPFPDVNPSALPSNRKNVVVIGGDGIIKSIELVQGQWDNPGSIMKFTYSDGSFEKYKIVSCDSQSKCFKNTLIEGGILGAKVVSVDIDMKIEHGSIKVTITIHTKDDSNLEQGEIDAVENKAKLVFQNLANFLKAMTN